LLERGNVVRYELDKDIVLHAIEDMGHYWAFNIRTGAHWSLTESAHAILASLKMHSMTAGDLGETFLERYDVDPAQARKDLEEVLAEFLEHGMVRRVCCESHCGKASV